MTFARRYFVWLALPPAPVSIPLTILFLNQVERLGSGQWLPLAGAVLVMYVLECLAVRMLLIGSIDAVETEAATGRDSSRVISDALVATENVSAIVFSVGAVLMGIAGGFFSDAGWLSARHFFVAGLILGGAPVFWCYGAGKRMLIGASNRNASLEYQGRRFAFATKVALVFIGFLIIAFSALVLLISARVTTELQKLAVASASERFDRIFDNAKDSARVDTATLDTLREYLPSGYQLVAISPTAVIGSSRDLTAREVETIRKKREGDSSSFTATHVVIFRPLPNGDILVMTIPWEAYARIPSQITFYTIVIAILTILVFIMATYFLSHEVGDSLRRLMNMSAEMSYGNFQTRSRIFADDEVGDLASSFMETGRNLARLLAKVGGSGAVITDGVRVIGGGTETMTRRSHEQTALATSSTEALVNVRAGIESLVLAADGVASLTQDSSSRAVELQASSEEIARSMDVLFQSVEKTSSSTTEMDASAAEMSRRTEVLAGIGDEVLTFVAEMEATARELRESAQATANLSKKVEEDAAAGGAAVGNTLDGITRSQEMTTRTVAVLSELRRSVGTISQILTVIEEIADRTNLLSLNAAIIAAQAGEQGAGFTVVADEIRQLAERTRGSTKEITAIVKAIQAGSREAMMTMEEGVGLVDENVALAENAASSLSKIVTSAGESFDMATRISGALQDQAVASKHLHEVSSRMSDHIAEINRSTTEQARGTRMLAGEAERVRDIAFQVKNSTEQQSIAGRGIAEAMEEIAEEVASMRNLLQAQLEETRQIAAAAETMRSIAPEENESIAGDFMRTIGTLSQNANEFDGEVRRFKIGE